MESFKVVKANFRGLQTLLKFERTLVGRLAGGRPIITGKFILF